MANYWDMNLFWLLEVNFRLTIYEFNQQTNMQSSIFKQFRLNGYFIRQSSALNIISWEKRLVSDNTFSSFPLAPFSFFDIPATLPPLAAPPPLPPTSQGAEWYLPAHWMN